MAFDSVMIYAAEHTGYEWLSIQGIAAVCYNVQLGSVPAAPLIEDNDDIPLVWVAWQW